MNILAYERRHHQENKLNCLQTKDDLKILSNGRQLQYFGKWKMISISWQMEDDLNIFANGGQPQYFGKSKKTLIF
jgi:hypothetical protein